MSDPLTRELARRAALTARRAARPARTPIAVTRWPSGELRTITCAVCAAPLPDLHALCPNGCRETNRGRTEWA